MKIKEIAGRIKELFGRKYTASVIIAAGIAGMLLIAFSGSGNDVPEEDNTADKNIPFENSEGSGNELESRLEKILGEIQGVGEVHVMITFSSTEEYVYAEETDISPDRQQTEYVIADKGGIVTKIKSPPVMGAVIVCEGGGNTKVCESVYEAVSVSLGLPSNRICVVKMK